MGHFAQLANESPEGATLISIVKGLKEVLQTAIELSILPGDQSAEADVLRTKIAITAAMAFAGYVLGNGLLVRYGGDEQAARRTFEGTLEGTFNATQEPESPDVH